MDKEMIVDYDAKTATTHAVVTGASLIFYGLTLEQWVGVLTVVVLLMQAGLLLAKYWRLAKGWWERRRA